MDDENTFVVDQSDIYKQNFKLHFFSSVTFRLSSVLA